MSGRVDDKLWGHNQLTNLMISITQAWLTAMVITDENTHQNELVAVLPGDTEEANTKE